MSLKTKLFGAVFICLVQIPLFAADASNGEKLYAKCKACHGNEGMGKKSQKAPMLAGQYDWYIKKQIHAIKSGERANNQTKKMVPFVKNLTDTEIEDLAAYVSQLKKRQ